MIDFYYDQIRQQTKMAFCTIRSIPFVSQKETKYHDHIELDYDENRSILFFLLFYLCSKKFLKMNYSLNFMAKFPRFFNMYPADY